MSDSTDSSDSSEVAEEKPVESPKLEFTEPKDGGTAAWLTAAAAFLLFVITWGPSIAFGLFVDFYETTYLSAYAPSSIALIGAVNAFFLLATGLVAGPYFDRGYLRHLMVLGVFMAVLGMMMLSLSTKYYQIFLAQGVCFGIGSGLVYVPALAFVNVSFSKNRALVIGIVTGGASIGGALFPIIFLRLQPRIGFPWAVRTIGFIMIACAALALPVLLLNQRGPRPASPRRFIDWSAFREVPFICFAAANFLIFLAYYIPLFYGPTFATNVLSLSRDTAFYQLAALNGASLFGRLGSSALTPRFGAPNFLLLSVLASMIMIFGWIGVTTSAGWWVWSIVYGFFSGMLISANPVVVAHPVLSRDPSVMGTRMGMIWFIAAIGILVCAPIGGALASSTGVHASMSYLKLRALDGAVMAGGGLALLVPLIAIRRHQAQ